MILLLTGAAHTGKTLWAQKLLEKYHYPYLSLDHLKMGLIRSGNTTLTPQDDEKLTAYLWPIAREIIKTAIENQQNLIVEGCYIPGNWRDGLEERYQRDIRFLCLVMSPAYIERHFEDIRRYANAAERRLCDTCTRSELLEDNARYRAECQAHDNPYIWIDTAYPIELGIEGGLP